MTGDLNQAIDQIADKLGVAADQVVGVIPQYAQMQCMRCGVLALVLLVCAAVAAAISIACFARYRKAKGSIDEDDMFTCAIITASGAVILLLVAVKVIVDCISWGQYPDAMVADMVVQAMGVGH